MDSPPHELRIGGVPYMMGAPLLTGLDTRPGVVLRREPPRALVAPLRAGEIDVALLSSIEAFRHPGYAALRDLGIACDGPVRSVRLFLRCPPEHVRTLALDTSSETSVALSRILLARRFGACVEHSFPVEPTRTPDTIDADAVLLIGDCGLHADAGRRTPLDLGAAWHAWKGLPFVFALWLVAGTPKAHEDEPRIAAELRAAWQRGKREGIRDGTGGLIRYELGERYWEALEVFREEALALGMCEAGIEPRWLGP